MLSPSLTFIFAFIFINLKGDNNTPYFAKGYYTSVLSKQLYTHRGYSFSCSFSFGRNLPHSIKSEIKNTAAILLCNKGDINSLNIENNSSVSNEVNGANFTSIVEIEGISNIDLFAKRSDTKFGADFGTSNIKSLLSKSSSKSSLKKYGRSNYLLEKDFKKLRLDADLEEAIVDIQRIDDELVRNLFNYSNYTFSH